MKTLSVGLVLCLNVGVDPPDIVKTSPCAKLMCWEDMTLGTPAKATEMIGRKLVEQYQRWQPKAKCKQALDPTLDEVKRTCCSLRRRAKDEPALFHYNGYGVPRPTANGEMWVFNKTYTQYLPFSVYDLQTWMGSPSIFVYDCNGAGTIVKCFNSYADQRALDQMKRVPGGGGAAAAGTVEPLHQCIQLAACEEHETLPTNPKLPADVFTSCLTTPIETALRWAYAAGNKHLLVQLSPDMVDRLPGQLNDRRTMLGQLNWIFTAITDTIAWNVLPADLFQRLFRNDLLVAALFRNFLLAERILRACNCTPVSSPKLPSTHDHPLWQAWDMAADMCLSQLPDILAGHAEFQHSPFFSDQLTAFEVWLDMGSHEGAHTAPEQLPVVLQVLLSQQHRLRALELLERFLELGPWAVRKALSVGIFPYVFKLLGSPAQELKPVLISLWTKVLAVDSQCKLDLTKSPASGIRRGSSSSPSPKAFMYFVLTLADPRYDPELRTMAAFVISVFVDSHRKGQDLCYDAGLAELALPQLRDCDLPQLKLWVCFALGKTWSGHSAAKLHAIQRNAPAELSVLLSDRVPLLSLNIGEIGLTLLQCLDDGSHSVRAELVVAINALISLYKEEFLEIALRLDAPRKESRTLLQGQIARIIKAVVILSQDPVNLVAQPAVAVLLSIGLQPVARSGGGSGGPGGGGAGGGVGVGGGRKASASRIDGSVVGSVPGAHAVGGAGMAASHVGPSYETPPAWTTMGVASPKTLAVDQIPPDSHLHLMTFLTRVTSVAESLGKVERSGATADLDLQDIHSSLRTPVLAALEMLPQLKPLVQSHGWNGTEFTGVTSETLKRLGSDVRELYGLDSQPAIRMSESNSLTTFLFEWCCRNFTKWKAPHKIANKNAEASRAEWRLDRNMTVRTSAMAQIQNAKDKKQKMKLTDSVFHTPTKWVSDFIVFHSYEPFIVLANASGALCTWNTVTQTEMASWSNGNKFGSKITSLRLLNAQDDGLVAVGSSDGVVRLWSHYWTAAPLCVSGWRAVSKLREARDGGTGAGLVVEWSQRFGYMLASGDVQYIQLWDAQAQARVQKIPTNVPSCVTSMHICPDDNGPVVAGFGNGSVCLFDPRLPSERAIVQRFEQHKNWVVTAHLQGGNQQHIVSGSKAGDILWWDTRFPGQAVRNLRAFRLKPNDSMRSMVVHNHAGILATATPNQYIKVFDIEGVLVSQMKHHTNFLGEAIGPNSCLAFHPIKPHLAAGSYDKIVSVYGPEK
eukprot:gene9410-33457_t